MATRFKSTIGNVYEKTKIAAQVSWKYSLFLILCLVFSLVNLILFITWTVQSDVDSQTKFSYGITIFVNTIIFILAFIFLVKGWILTSAIFIFVYGLIYFGLINSFYSEFQKEEMWKYYVGVIINALTVFFGIATVITYGECPIVAVI